jgi:hypothetical protein
MLSAIPSVTPCGIALGEGRSIRHTLKPLTTAVAPRPVGERPGPYPLRFPVTDGRAGPGFGSETGVRLTPITPMRSVMRRFSWEPQGQAL